MFYFQTVCKNRTDREEVPCNECGKLFPTRKHLSEHRRTKHRENPIVGSQLSQLPQFPPPGIMMGQQNMGHNLGQYLTSKTHYKPVHTPSLPPFSRSSLGGAPLYPGPPVQSSTPAPPVHQEMEKSFAPNHSWGPHPAQIDMDLGSKLTGHDLSLAHAHSQLPGQSEPVEENVGSILRQVYHTEHHQEHYQPQKHQSMCPEASIYHSEYQPYPNFDSFLYYNA